MQSFDKVRKLEGSFVQLRRCARRRSTRTVASDAQIERMRSRTEDEKKLSTREEALVVDARTWKMMENAEHLKQCPRRDTERRLRDQMVSSHGYVCERHEQLPIVGEECTRNRSNRVEGDLRTMSMCKESCRCQNGWWLRSPLLLEGII